MYHVKIYHQKGTKFVLDYIRDAITREEALVTWFTILSKPSYECCITADTLNEVVTLKQSCKLDIKRFKKKFPECSFWLDSSYIFKELSSVTKYYTAGTAILPFVPKDFDLFKNML